MSESGSPLANLLAWRRQRFSHLLFVPGTAVMLFARYIYAENVRAFDLLVAGAATWLLLAGLRLGDDLLSRSADAEAHPERVLTQLTKGESTRVWAAAGVLLTVATAVLTWRSGPAFPLVAVVLGSFLYTAATLRADIGVIADALVLLKYPAILAILPGPSSATPGVVMVLLYGVMCIDEATESRMLRPWAAFLTMMGTLQVLEWQEHAPGWREWAVTALLIALVIGLWRTFRGPTSPWLRPLWMAWLVILLLCFDPATVGWLD